MERDIDELVPFVLAYCEAGDDAALRAWYDSLTEPERAALKEWGERVMAGIADVGTAIARVFEAMRDHA